jgi:hypothetical protein
MDDKERRTYEGLSKELQKAQGDVLSTFKAWSLAKKGRDAKKTEGKEAEYQVTKKEVIELMDALKYVNPVETGTRGKGVLPSDLPMYRVDRGMESWMRTLEARLRSHKVEEKYWFRALGLTTEGANLTWVSDHILISEPSSKTLFDQEFKTVPAATIRQRMMTARQSAYNVGSQAA